MMTSPDKVGGWVKKGQNHDDVILEWSLMSSEFQLDLCWTFVLHIPYSN